MVLAVVAFGGLLMAGAIQAQTVSLTSVAGAYTVNVKVLPAESFRGPGAAMARDGGAQPKFLNGSAHPNHHLVAFVSKSRQPVEDAAVKIRYRRLSPKPGAWITVPVVRMHVSGKGAATTHVARHFSLGRSRWSLEGGLRLAAHGWRCHSLPRSARGISKLPPYGNNVELAPGSYEAQVTVNGKGPATFHFAV